MKILLIIIYKGKRYIFLAAPFGLRNIPVQFQELMDTLFANCEEFSMIYIDDIAVHSATWEEHAQHLITIINRLTDANLRMNIDKCHFGRTEIELLGFQKSRLGVRISDGKIHQIARCPSPKTGAALAHWLGWMNFLRDHIPIYSHISACLTPLQKIPRLSTVWLPIHQLAWETLRALITNSTILSAPNFNMPFLVATDASLVGIGAMLVQIPDPDKPKVRHYIAFAARTLSASERKYSATRRELLAIVFSLKKFHPYLYGIQFTMYTDHNSLIYIHTQKDLNAMMSDWLETILSYDFTVIHLPGILNFLPDAMSRMLANFDSAPAIIMLRERRMWYC